MGKWTEQHTEDVLLSKIRGAIETAIKTHEKEKRQDGEARPVTFGEFVEEFDNKDAFTQKIMEILVKEYSERRMKTTPVDRRRFQIASSTSVALNSIPREAAVYDNCRSARWSRRSRPVFTLPISYAGPGEEVVGLAGFDHSDDDGAFPGADRHRIFENALNEIEYGESGAYWNTTLNEAYSQEIPTMAERRYIPSTFQSSDSRLENGLGGGSSNSSAVASDIESPSAESTSARLNSRLAAAGSSSARLGSLRTPLLRRNSIRRSRYGRPSWDSETPVRRRLSRGMSDEAEALWTTSGGGDSLERTRSTELRQPAPSETAIRRLLDSLESRESNTLPSGPSTSSTRQALRRGGIRPPESLLGITSSFARSAGLPFTMPRHEEPFDGLPELIRPISAQMTPISSSSGVPSHPPWTLEVQENQPLVGFGLYVPDVGLLEQNAHTGETPQSGEERPPQSSIS